MDPSPEQISALAEQLSQLAHDLSTEQDPKARRMQTSNLVMAAKKTVSTLQEPMETLTDQITLTFSISAALALMELGVFEHVPARGSASVKELAQKAQCEEELIIRLMRQVTVANIFIEASLHEWSHSRLSLTMSEHLGTFGKHFFQVGMDEMLPPILALNRHIRAHGPNSLLHTYTHTNHSMYYNQPGHTFWEVLNSEPRRINTFMSAISMWSAMHPVVAIYPFATALAPSNSRDRVLAVDIGGGRGLAMLDLRKICPDLKGELILQDRPYVLDFMSSEDLPGVTKMSHDFFTLQPVIGAQMYYIRRVMHDWQDADASLILKSIVPAMAPDSRIIVSDMAIPEMATERDAGAIWLDMMMLSIGGKERTKRDWVLLGEMSGLRLVKLWMEPELYGPLCVVEYMLPEREKTEGTNGVGIRGDGNGGKSQAQDVGMEAEAAEGDKGIGAGAAATGEAEMGGTTPWMEANGATPEPSQRANAMSLDGAADESGNAQERLERDEDWEERTVVGDREQSVEPGQGRGQGA